MLVPDSMSLAEANDCHHPAGTGQGGQFCSNTDIVDGQSYYVRFGDPPASGRSLNYATGSIEAGVSVYSALGRHGKLVIEVPQDGGWAEEDLRSRLRSDDSIYIVKGDHIGTGGDGEPLLKDVRVWKRVKRELLEI
jgi:hypothetical protein